MKIFEKINSVWLFLKQVWALAKPFWFQSEEKWKALGLLVILFLLKFAIIWLCIRQNYWYSSFYSAINSHNINEFLYQIGIFFLISFGLVVSMTYMGWLAQNIKLRWKNWLVNNFSKDWLNQCSFYHMQLETEEQFSPDQRISEDISKFIDHTLDITVGLIDVSISTIAFSSILWGLSGTISVFGWNIPGYMVFGCYIYSFLASFLTHLIGNPLSKLYSERAVYEADFRFGLIRIRENAESIALYHGERQELAILKSSWGGVVDTFWRTIKRERSLGWFVHSHAQICIVLPFLLAIPKFFSGYIDFGQLMQAAAAFGAVQACLNFFINSYGQFAYWHAETNRLSKFRHALDNPKTTISLMTDGQNGIKIQNLTVSTPDHRILLDGLDIEIQKGEAILLQAPSGTGKSTMFRAMAGIWPCVSGSIQFDSNDVFFVPQKPYLPIGTLRQAAFYPIEISSNHDLDGYLKDVGLEYLIPDLDEVDQWAQRLSGGEAQRLAFVRIFLMKPKVLFLDEATSALDEVMEEHVYSILRNADWNPTIISIGHRNTLVKYHDRVVDITKLKIK